MIEKKCWAHASMDLRKGYVNKFSGNPFILQKWQRRVSKSKYMDLHIGDNMSVGIAEWVFLFKLNCLRLTFKNRIIKSLNC